MSWLNSIGEFFSSLFKISPEAQKLKIEVREQKKRNKRHWDNRLKQIFAECDLDELKLMAELVDAENKPIITDKIPNMNYSRVVKVKDIDEKLYQVIEEYYSNDYVHDNLRAVKLRITVPVFGMFKKEFNKYGRCRLPENIQGKRSSK